MLFPPQMDAERTPFRRGVLRILTSSTALPFSHTQTALCEILLSCKSWTLNDNISGQKRPLRTTSYARSASPPFPHVPLEVHEAAPTGLRSRTNIFTDEATRTSFKTIDEASPLWLPASLGFSSTRCCGAQDSRKPINLVRLPKPYGADVGTASFASLLFLVS